MFKEYRCQHCNKLFFKGEIRDATIEVKCRYCKNMNIIQAGMLLSDKKATYRPAKAESGRSGIRTHGTC